MDASFDAGSGMPGSALLRGMDRRENGGADDQDWQARFRQLEERLAKVEEEGVKMRRELGEMRDRLEEEEWERKRLE